MIPQIHEGPTGRWLPVRIMMSNTMVSVRWLNFGEATLSEPFFHQTVKKLRRSNPPCAERTTGMGTLIEASEPVTHPAGIIFHVSRCGSTLLANAMRLAPGVTVLSEPPVFGRLFAHGALRNSPFPEEGRLEARKLLLNSMVGAYTHRPGRQPAKLVIKCAAASLLRIRFIRYLWPEVPFLVVVRDPAEVIVSNINKQAGWIRCRKDAMRARALFGWKDLNPEQMSFEEYCARGFARFCQSALTAIDDNTRVIDYSQINAAAVLKIAEFFQLDLCGGEGGDVGTVMTQYSKDVKKSREFVPDEDRKRAECMPEIAEAVKRWAMPDYLVLQALSRW